MEKQTVYGWPVAIDLFLSGLGAGAFMVGLILQLAGREERLARIVLFAGPLFVLAGLVFLFADITIRTRVHLLFANFKSWTSRGSWILTLFIVSGLTCSFATWPFFIQQSPMNGAMNRAVCFAAALFSLAVMIYPGFLMGAIKAVPFWNTPILPVLFLFTGLSNGLAFVMLIAPLYPYKAIGGAIGTLHALAAATIMMILLQASVLYAFLERAARGSVAARESLRILAMTKFKRKIFALEMFIPLGLLISITFTNRIFLLNLSSTVAALLLLAGGLHLRRAIIRAGVFLPRFDI